MKYKIYNNLVCHIVGLTDQSFLLLKKKLSKYKDDLLILNLDDLTYKIINSKSMKLLYKKKDKLEGNKSNNATEKKIIKSNIKCIEKKMMELWKKMMEEFLNAIFIKYSKKKIISIGFSTCYNNPKIHVLLPTNNKFFLKLDYYDNAKNIIRFNLENNKEDIINGIFPLEYLNIHFLVNKRQQLEAGYKKINYITKPLDDIIILIKLQLDCQNLIPDILYWTNSEVNDNLLAYNEFWIALISFFEKKLKLEKGYVNNKPYIKGKDLKNNLFKCLTVYYTDKTNNFLPKINKSTRIYKFILNGKLLNKEIKNLKINNVYQKLIDLGVNLIDV